MTRFRISSTLTLAVALAAFGGSATAAVHVPDADPRAQEVVSSPGFLTAHPDLRFRLLGQEAQKRGREREARFYYQQGARYADKPSQAALAELVWAGDSVEPADRAMGYVWMDLAAERGGEMLLARREFYWNALTPDERERAVREGRALYAEYGDPAAKPRQEREMRATRQNVTGSRTGDAGLLRTQAKGNSGMRQVDPAIYWQDKYWEPAPYWQWQQEVIEAMEP